jgi:hypothetical protein
VVFAAARTWCIPQRAAWPVGEYTAVLLRFHELVLHRRRDEVLDVIQLDENGKVPAHGVNDVWGHLSTIEVPQK